MVAVCLYVYERWVYVLRCLSEFFLTYTFAKKISRTIVIGHIVALGNIESGVKFNDISDGSSNQC